MAQQPSDYPHDHTKGPQSMADCAREATENASERLKDMAVDAQELGGKVAEQVHQYGEKAQKAAQNFKPFVEKSMKEQPMVTLAVASVIGFVLGALWKK